MSEKYKAWTAEEIELLKSFMAKGEKTSVIAKKLNREWGSVRSKKKALVSGNLQSRNFWTIEAKRLNNKANGRDHGEVFSVS